MSVRFSARIISGSGMATKQKVPTLNLSLDDVPADLAEGIYACRVSFNALSGAPAVMHFGPRPVHNLPRSCEVHLLDQSVEDAPESVTVEIVKYIRDVRNFKDPEELKTAIQSDLARARAILDA